MNKQNLGYSKRYKYKWSFGFGVCFNQMRWVIIPDRRLDTQEYSQMKMNVTGVVLLCVMVFWIWHQRGILMKISFSSLLCCLSSSPSRFHRIVPLNKLWLQRKWEATELSIPDEKRLSCNNKAWEIIQSLNSGRRKSHRAECVFTLKNLSNTELIIPEKLRETQTQLLCSLEYPESLLNEWSQK
jgi:hypothetical protein